MTSSIKVSESRRAAFEVLQRVEAEGAFAGNLLASSRYDHLSREDHGLLQELTLGTLRRQGLLDFQIEHLTQRKLNKLDLEVIIALRLGLYQLNFLSRIPAHAAINESVNLVKDRRKQSAAPLVNAALRAAQRRGGFDFTETIDDPFEKLSVETSHPRWLLRRWIARYGDGEARALALANNTTPRTAFRFNTESVSEEKTRSWLADNGVTIQDSALVAGAAVVESGSLTIHSEPVRKSWIYFQDEASQLVAHLLAARRFENRVAGHPSLLDLCAAPGGKTTLLATLLPKGSLIAACDLHEHRLRTMKELGARLGIEGPSMIRLDAAGELPFDAPAFDLVLLDAPCSGLGTLQRHPEIKWRIKEDQLRNLAALQNRLIENAGRQLKPGGLLAYSVCSTEPEEGEEIVSRFKQNHPEYRDVTRERLAELRIDPDLLLTPSFGARTFPQRHGTEGFFVCVLWKRR